MTSHLAAWQPQWLTTSKPPLKAGINKQLYVSAYSCTSDLCCISKLNRMVPGSCPGTDSEVVLLV